MCIRDRFTTDPELFSRLVEIGGKLVQNHLLSFSKYETLEVDGNNFEIEKGYPIYTEKEIHLNNNTRVINISKELWGYKIGVHKVLEKWLKDRKGTVLSQDDIQHYGKMVHAVKLSLIYANEIDDIIQDNGGFPLTGHDQFSGYETIIVGQKSLMDF